MKKTSIFPLAKLGPLGILTAIALIGALYILITGQIATAWIAAGFLPLSIYLGVCHQRARKIILAEVGREREIVEMSFVSMTADRAAQCWNLLYSSVAITTGVVVYGNMRRVLNLTSGLDTIAGRQDSLDFIDQAIDDISSIRGAYGMLENRLESAQRSTQNMIEFLALSESRISDADFALESSALARSQIHQGFGVAVLAQANLQPERALELLRGNIVGSDFD